MSHGFGELITQLRSKARRRLVTFAPLGPLAALTASLGACLPSAPTARLSTSGDAKPLPASGASEIGNNELLARAGAATLSRIAFGSCAYQARPQPIWDDVIAARPHLFVFAGDNVYGDVRAGKEVGDEQILDSLREAYGQASQIVGMSRLRSTVPHLATWDDHDFGKNDGGADFVHRAESQRLFADFWALPADDPRRQREGVYHAQTFGQVGRRVQVILLDTRYFRSPLKRATNPATRGLGPFEPDPDPSKTVLGETQWRWLHEQLLQPADLRLIVSSIQVLAQGHQWERWGNFPLELKKLCALIGQTRAQGVIFLSGDRHIAAIYRQTLDVPYPLIDLTSSGVTQSFANNTEPGPNRLGDVYAQVNFGTVDIDWNTGTIDLAIHALGGAVVRRHRLKFEQLRA